ncbi:MoxR family ATPase [candidate division WOR-3 bacterium]|nr:MoxR family ATPase [candidate division WOR-3 bacterium]
MSEIKAISEEIKENRHFIDTIIGSIKKRIVGQEKMINRILVCLLADGHLLIEGVPGLAKTLTISTLAQSLRSVFHRIQFTPDLLPADIIGTLVYNPKEGTFSTKKGPVFAQIILADEINRAPAKVQSALLEAMQERQVTIGETTFPLPKPFLVMATQNPIEQEGTYPLPEAQIDRFMLKINLDYPNPEEELTILDRMTRPDEIEIQPVVETETILNLMELTKNVYVEKSIKEYVVRIVAASRWPTKYKLNELNGLISYGASPRASIYMIKAAKALALIEGRAYVSDYDIKEIAKDILRHRIIITYEAEAEKITTDHIISTILSKIPTP